MVINSISQAIMENKEAYEKYLASLSNSRFDDLTSEEINTLFTEPVHPDAINIVVQAKMKYAAKLAWKMFPYAKWRIDINDLISSANYGLQQAALHFDPAKGTFNSYAYIWIKKAIYDFAAKNHIVNMSNKAAASFKKEDCVIIDIDEYDNVNEDVHQSNDARILCNEVMQYFSPKQKKYITSFFLEQKNICEIAEENNVTHQAVSHAINSGLRKAKKMLDSK